LFTAKNVERQGPVRSGWASTAGSNPSPIHYLVGWKWWIQMVDPSGSDPIRIWQGKGGLEEVGGEAEVDWEVGRAAEVDRIGSTCRWTEG
jgi:hypothetical protein